VVGEQPQTVLGELTVPPDLLAGGDGTPPSCCLPLATNFGPSALMSARPKKTSSGCAHGLHEQSKLLLKGSASEKTASEKRLKNSTTQTDVLLT